MVGSVKVRQHHMRCIEAIKFIEAPTLKATLGSVTVRFLEHHPARSKKHVTIQALTGVSARPPLDC